MHRSRNPPGPNTSRIDGFAGAAVSSLLSGGAIPLTSCISSSDTTSRSWGAEACLRSRYSGALLAAFLGSIPTFSRLLRTTSEFSAVPVRLQQIRNDNISSASSLCAHYARIGAIPRCPRFNSWATLRSSQTTSALARVTLKNAMKLGVCRGVGNWVLTGMGCQNEVL